jgi:nucleoside 2-deoxyribosyltransferase
MARVFLSIKFHADGRNRGLIERLCALLVAGGHVPFCVVRDLEDWGRVEFSIQALMRETFAAIEQSDLVLVELSEKGVGLGIEAGYAFARGIPVLTAARQGSDLSTTLRGISARVCLYEREEEILRIVDEMSVTPSAAL